MQPQFFQIIGIRKTLSHYTKKDVYAVFFKDEHGKSYKTWLDPQNGNYKRWQGLLQMGNVLTGINIKGNGNLVDADSFPRLVRQPEQKPETTVRPADDEPKQAELL